MTQNPPDKELQQIWQEQRSKDTNLPVEEVRQRARRAHRVRHAVGLATLPVFISCTLFFVAILVREMARWQFWIAGPYGATFGGRLLWVAIDRLPLVPIGIGIYLVHLSVSFFIRAKTLAPDAGLKTCVAAYRDYFEWERGIFLRVLGVLTVAITSIGLDAAGNWARTRPFPVRYALQFGAGYMFAGILMYIGYKRYQVKLKRESQLLDEFETDHH